MRISPIKPIISSLQVSYQLVSVPRREGGVVRIRCWAYLFVSSTVYHRSLTSVGKISLKNNSGEASAGRSVCGPVGCVKGGHWGIVSVSAVLEQCYNTNEMKGFLFSMGLINSLRSRITGKDHG